ncbi:MAG: hypothetical protein RL637_866 [Pseudomonadota bacterium]|jgi:CheY-like chemotaxis protein/predicted regulator of Ras-like GTPase activity (Roadblock/LC7/MglB family)
MKKFLIVLNDAILTSVFKSWVFRSQKKDSLLFAKEGKEAIEVIRSQPVDLLITELSLPEIDGIDLMAKIYAHYPAIKIAFFLSTTQTLNQEKLKSLNSIYFINKPNSLREFIHLVNVLEVADFQTALIEDIQISELLELIEFQKKTCLLFIELKDRTRRGFIYFESGVLYNALAGELKGEAAVLEILGWKSIHFNFRALENRQYRRQIQQNLSSLIERQHLLMTNQNDPPIDLILEEKHQVVYPDSPKLTTELIAQNIESESQTHLTNSNLETVIEPVSETKKSPSVIVETILSVEEQNRQRLIEIQQKAEIETMRDRIQQFIADNHDINVLYYSDHYLAFAIFNVRGEVISERHEGNYHIETIGINAAIMLNSAVETFNNVELGNIHYIQINSDQGILGVTWLLQNQLFVAVLLSTEATHLALAKLELNKICHLIRQLLIQPLTKT